MHWYRCVMLADADGFATMLSARKELAQLVDTVSITACMLDHWMLISGKEAIFAQKSNNYTHLLISGYATIPIGKTTKVVK